MKKNILSTAVVAVFLTWPIMHLFASECAGRLFFPIVSVAPSNNDDDDQEVQMPHRAPIPEIGVAGMYDSGARILYLQVETSLGITMAKVFKNGIQIGEDSGAPVTKASYDLSNHGNGFYQILLTAPDGTTYEGNLIINNV